MRSDVLRHAPSFLNALLFKCVKSVVFIKFFPLSTSSAVVPAGILDPQQPNAEHHHPAHRADSRGSGRRVQAVLAPAYPTHATGLHARQQPWAECYHKGRDVHEHTQA